MSEQNSEQVTPSAEPQPAQQPAPVAPEQTTPPAEQPAVPDPAQQPAPAPAEQVPPAGDPDETTDAGNGAGDQPTADEQANVGDVELPEPPENDHATGDAPGSAGLGVTGKFVHDEAPQDAGDQ